MKVSTVCFLAATLFKDTKEKTQKVFETDGDIVVLTSSGTGGMEAAVKNLVRRGDNVIVPAFGEFGHRLADQISQSGANVKKVVAEPGLVPSIEEIEEAFEETKDVNKHPKEFKDAVWHLNDKPIKDDSCMAVLVIS